MKNVKLSLAAVAVVLGSSAFGADSFMDAFKEAKVSGALQAYYWDRNNGSAEADILNFGIDLSYETAKYKGFGFKATLQTSSSPFVNDDAREVFKPDMHGSGASLSEAYISYGFDKTNAQIGRMYISTPLVLSSGTRMNKEAFEGALITNTNIENTKLTFAYVQKMQNRTDEEGNFGKFSDEYLSYGGFQGDIKDGAYTFVVQNSSIPNTNLTLAYLDVKNSMKMVYSEASYTKGMFGLAAQYVTNDYDENNVVGYEGDTYLFGLKANLNFDKLGFVAAYTTTGDEYLVGGIGSGADYAYTWSPILSDTYTMNTDSYKIGASYEFTPNLNVVANYTLADREASAKNSTENEKTFSNLTVNYAFQGALKGLSTALLYDKGGKDDKRDELRLNIVYSF